MSDWNAAWEKFVEFLFYIMNKEVWIFGEYSVKVWHLAVIMMIVILIGLYVSTRRKRR